MCRSAAKPRARADNGLAVRPFPEAHSGGDDARTARQQSGGIIADRRPRSTRLLAPGKRCNNPLRTRREAPMRTVILEEHFSLPAASARVDKAVIARRGYKARALRKDVPNPLALLPDLGEARLKSMDEAGITVEVLSNSGPGPDLVAGPDGVAMAREINDHLGAACAKYPARFAGFASLPMQSPDAAAKELTRAVKELGFVGAMVNGTTEGKFLDDPSYDGILAAAEALDVPIYIHPHIPPAAVREAYFSGLPEGAGRVLETAGWGWHSEVAVHVLRLVVSGRLDKHPKLKLIIGHMGEMLPMMLDRASQVFSADIEHLKRTVPQTILDQVWITTSGIFN